MLPKNLKKIFIPKVVVPEINVKKALKTFGIKNFGISTKKYKKTRMRVETVRYEIKD